MRKLFIILLIATTGCAVNTRIAFDHNTDFGKYKTFCWLNGCEFTISGPTYLNDETLRADIKESIIAELEKKGLRYDDTNPDLLVDFHITLQEETAIIYHREDEGPFYIKPLAGEERINYLNGTIVVDLADRKEGRMVWRSVANGYMDTHPDLTRQNLGHGIKLALRKFPPKGK